MTILSGVRIIEFEGLGPAPFCGMLLADLGADVILVERADGPDRGAAAIFNRGKRSIALDLKNPSDVRIAKKIADHCDGLIEGFRPGVMERLGLGPDALSSTNSALVYGRLTGWGQSGPLSQAAGHDINYLSLSGANWYSGASGETQTPPPTLAGDVGGGALYLTVGLLAGIMRARETGKGCVVDAAIVDGAAHMTSLLLSLRAAGGLPEARGSSMLDGAPFYGVYMCADERAISIGPLEPKFYIELLQRLELANDPDCLAQFDQSKWATARRKISSVFESKTMSHWRNLLEGTDVCFAPVLSPSEAAQHPHLKARRTYRDIDNILQAAAAPRFDGETPTDPKPTPKKDAHREEILRAFVDNQNG